MILVKMTHTIIKLESVDSTNTYIRNHPELWDMQLCAVIAREQTGGRGRHGRTWHSGPGQDLTFSAVLIPHGTASGIACVTLLAGLAVYRAIRPLLGENLHLKWPNDIRYGDRKLGGILCEAVPRNEGPIVIIGIGINVNSVDFPSPIGGTATSLKAITGKDYDVPGLCEEILDCLADLFPHFRVPLEEAIIREWTGASRSTGKAVRFAHAGIERQGIIEGINRDGSLRISIPGAEPVAQYRGEVLFPEDDRE
ncbi:MAG TPA: biotin--[acetyl-CoA-carboxylase] ligase [Spirochaetota bacterium]|nr:biotin--[acetyl-CoA-carboxylase] ligase [Spirochaetota bacterium]HOD13081.1 biotin--[acetyl-CoA-carboxylase] ligase [Spirochaetota bacterium]HPN13353.1 biotin--[acetyl-CoA-carboxylase] ligase [Spirochaetota bacterium]